MAIVWLVIDAARGFVFLGGNDGALGLVDCPPLALVRRPVAQLLTTDFLRAFDFSSIVALATLGVGQLLAGNGGEAGATVEAVRRVIGGDDGVADSDKLEHRVLRVRPLVNRPSGEADAALLGLIIVVDVVVGQQTDLEVVNQVLVGAVYLGNPG